MADTALLAFDLAIAIIIGLILGSFATAIIYREPRNISWSFKPSSTAPAAQKLRAHRSACPTCGQELKAKHLVPVLSWLALRGRCGHCKSRIPAFYLLTELASVAAVLLVYATLGFSVSGLFVMALVPFVLALFVIDLQHFLLPNRLVLICAAIGALHLLVQGYVFHTLDMAAIGINYVLGAVVYAAAAWLLGKLVGLVLKKDALGFGDVKFFGMAGLWLGLDKLADFFILSGIIGVALALLWQAVKKEKIFPFGPALILAFMLLLLVDGSLFT